jgi:hypothetical protein
MPECLPPIPQYNESEVPLPKFTPMPLARLPEPFDHPDWLFEIFLRILTEPS